MPKYTKRPNIPGLTNLSDEVRTVLLPVKQLLDIHEGRTGNASVDRFVKMGEIAHLINTQMKSTARPADGEAPGPPTDVQVLAGAWGNRISWTNAVDEDLWAVEVWASKAVNDWTLADLVAVATIPQAIRGKRSEYMHFPASLTSDYYYWCRSVDYSGNASRLAPPGEDEGILAPGKDTIGETIDAIMDALTPINAPPWDPSKSDYEAGDIVAYGGKQWQCYRAPVPVGVPPESDDGASYWRRTGILRQGDVDEVPTVGIDGQLVVDGTLSARSIATDQLQVGENITVVNGAIVIENLSEETVARLEGMTDDELALFNALSEQADNKVSVFVQESTPSWTDADANHDDDRWYKPSERTWYRYFSNLSPPWRVADQSILNIEDYAKEKTTYHYGTAYPPSDLGEIDDFYLRDYDGLIIQYRKTGGTTWVEASRFSNGATVGMTDDELVLFNALSEQADNKVSVYVQPSTSVPSWTDSNDNHVDDEWYQTDTKKWFRFTNTILGWVENDDSIYNIEALANGKTTVHYITALADLTDPENDLSSAPDGDYCIYESGDDRKYFKRASGSWVLSSEMTNGADATKTVIEGGLVTTGSIQSNNFGSSAGMKIDLTNATIIIREAEGLLIESVGGVTVSDSGGVTVEEGGDIVLETSDGDYIFCGQDVSISGFSTYGGLVIYPDNWPSGVAYPSPYLSLGLSGDGFGVVAMYAGSSLHLFTGTAVYTDNEADLGKSASPWGNVYITGSVIDSCEGFAGDALAELAKIKTEPSKDSWQKVIHDELPESVKHIEQVNRFIDKKTGQAYDRKDPARGGDFVEESYNVVRRNLTRQIMLNTRAIMQLNEKMEAMDARS